MITINLTDSQLPALAQLIANCPELVQAVTANLRQRKDTYTIKEASEMLGVCNRTIRNRVEAGIIPVVPGIGAKRIPASFIDSQLTANPVSL